MTATGEVRLTYPDADGDGLDLDGMADTCALDVADRGPLDAVAVAALLRMAPDRVASVTDRAMRKARAAAEAAGLTLGDVL